jgi:hypothetical protein
MTRTTWSSLIVLPMTRSDGVFAQDADGKAGRITSLYEQQARAPLQLDHDGIVVGEVFYVERGADGCYRAVAQTEVRELDWRQQASLGAESQRRGRDHDQLVLEHVALVERSACSAGQVRLTKQAVRPPGRPHGWSDNDWNLLRRAWTWHTRHERDRYLTVVDLYADNARSVITPPAVARRARPIGPGRPIPLPPLTPREAAVLKGPVIDVNELAALGLPAGVAELQDAAIAEQQRSRSN